MTEATLPAATALPWTFIAMVVVIVVLLLISAFIAAAESAFHAASLAKLKVRADRNEANAILAFELAENIDGSASQVMFAGNLVKILAISLGTALVVAYSDGDNPALAALLTTVVVLTLVEILPRSVARQAPESAALYLARPYAAFLRLVSPVAACLTSIVSTVFRIREPKSDGDNDVSVHDEIAGALALGRSSGVMEKEDSDRLRGALDLGDRWVEEIMLHRSEIEMIDAEMSPQNVIAKVLASSHSRLPVYRGERENVVGVLHVKDLIRAADRARRNKGPILAFEGFDVMEAVRPPYFVPETSSLDEQLREFLKRRRHFALVVDEYGSLRGLITLEDILEEIVGEIADEYDIDEITALKPSADGDYVVDGATTIRDLNRALDWELPDDEANTIAGLVIYLAQSIPVVGQVFLSDGFRFEIISRRENRVARIRIRPPAPAAKPSSGE